MLCRFKPEIDCANPARCFGGVVGGLYTAPHTPADSLGLRRTQIPDSDSVTLGQISSFSPEGVCRSLQESARVPGVYQDCKGNCAGASRGSKVKYITNQLINDTHLAGDPKRKGCGSCKGNCIRASRGSKVQIYYKSTSRQHSPSRGSEEERM